MAMALTATGIEVVSTGTIGALGDGEALWHTDMSYAPRHAPHAVQGIEHAEARLDLARGR